MRQLNEIRRTPLNRVSISEFFRMELATELTAARLTINQLRLCGYADYRDARRCLQNLQAIVYSWSSILIWKTDDFDELETERQAALNEVQFLAGPYFEQYDWFDTQI